MKAKLKEQEISSKGSKTQEWEISGGRKGGWAQDGEKIQSELSVERSGAKISPYSEPPKLQSPLKLESGSWQNSWWIGLMSEEWNKTQHMSEPEVLGLRLIVPWWMPCVQLEGAAQKLGCAAFPTRSLLSKLGPFNAWIAKWTFSLSSSLASSQAPRRSAPTAPIQPDAAH